jgi:hypothetical protein
MSAPAHDRRVHRITALSAERAGVHTQQKRVFKAPLLEQSKVRQVLRGGGVRSRLRARCRCRWA